MSATLAKPDHHQVLGIGQTIAVSVQVTNGLGQVISALTEAQIVRFQQVRLEGLPELFL